MKYFVIATHWDDERKAQVKYIAGQFDSFANANIFKTAYNEHYKADAVIPPPPDDGPGGSGPKQGQPALSWETTTAKR